MIIIGSLNMGECPAEPFIPIFLVVYGSVQMLINFLLVLNRLQVTVTGKNLRITLTKEKAPLPWYRRVQIPLLLAFLIVAFILLSYTNQITRIVQAHDTAATLCKCLYSG
ncbi:hypothetical protein Avbf_10279 [Armadillidium vulgare]|nr:hypothetical protein Avbf_14262 [Armadillidium vulgare]RXG64358.1 hypothetical protein Avbf_10279 [Armadillidium vulgare]